jgi:hypothetical protein
MRTTGTGVSPVRASVFRARDNKMPRSVQPKAKADLHEIWQGETREMANKAFDHFVAGMSASGENGDIHDCVAGMPPR